MLLISLVSVLNLLYFYISTFRSMCAVLSMAVFLSSLTSFSWYFAHVFSQWLWNSPSRPYYYWYHLCYYIPRALYFFCKVFKFYNLLGFFFNYISVSLVIIITIIEFLISQFWLGNIHLSWDAVINRIRLGGLICSLKSFLQLNIIIIIIIIIKRFLWRHTHRPI